MLQSGTQHVESEWKWQLSPEDFGQLSKELKLLLGPGTIAMQQNRFFDTQDGKLARSGIGLRLRRVDNLVVCTCKSRRAQQQNGLHQCDEFEVGLNACAWQALIDNQLSIVDTVPLPLDMRLACKQYDISCIGGFATERLSFQHETGELALDRCRFPDGHVDLELEIETTQAQLAYDVWSSTLQEWNISWTNQELSKLQRYLEHHRHQV